MLDPKPTKLPNNWSSNSLSKFIRTKKALEAARREEKKPHKTFDLDGDGQVSQKDYFLAK